MKPIITFLAIALFAASGLEAKPLKVFILAGQSNMEGHAEIRTFDYIGKDPLTAPLLREMRNPDGTPRVCDKVWMSYLTGPYDGSSNGEFLLMCTTFEVEDLNFDSYRLAILARQGFHVYLNGKKIYTCIWWMDNPYFRSIVLGKEEIKFLKKGTNVLVVYANDQYDLKFSDQSGKKIVNPTLLKTAPTNY